MKITNGKAGIPLRNINTIWWESRNITTQPGEINTRESKVFVAYASVNFPANYFYILTKKKDTSCQKYLLYSIKVLFDIYQEYI